jgi:WD40 repeat protein
MHFENGKSVPKKIRLIAGGRKFEPDFELLGISESIDAVALSANGERLALLERAGLDRRLRLYDWLTGRAMGDVTLKGMGAECLSISPDGERIAVGTYDGKVLLLDSERLEIIDQRQVSAQLVNHVEYAPHGDRLVVEGQDSRGTNIVVFDASSTQ